MHSYTHACERARVHTHARARASAHALLNFAGKPKTASLIRLGVTEEDARATQRVLEQQKLAPVVANSRKLQLLVLVDRLILGTQGSLRAEAAHRIQPAHHLWQSGVVSTSSHSSQST
jgi:hypothetical protein